MEKKLDDRLAEWTDLHSRLKSVRTLLAKPDHNAVALKVLQAEAEWLEDACREVLRAAQTEFAVRRLDNPQ